MKKKKFQRREESGVKIKGKGKKSDCTEKIYVCMICTY